MTEVELKYDKDGIPVWKHEGIVIGGLSKSDFFATEGVDENEALKAWYTYCAEKKMSAAKELELKAINLRDRAADFLERAENVGVEKSPEEKSKDAYAKLMQKVKKEKEKLLALGLTEKDLKEL